MTEPCLKRNVVLREYTEEWPNKYKAEEACWVAMLGDNLICVHHVGSTAIAGIKAKPIVDILIVVRSFLMLDGLTALLQAQGYEAKGENGIAGRRYFQKDVNGERAFHIHAYEPGHRQVEEHILFRNHMRACRRDALEYEKLKVRLAQTYQQDRKKYGEGKSGFIEQMIDKARTLAKAGRDCSSSIA